MARPASSRRQVGFPAPAQRLALAAVAVAAAVVLAGAALFPDGGPSLLAGPAAMGMAGALAARGMAQAYPHGAVGACNLVTLARAGIVSLLAVPVTMPGAPLAQMPATAWTVVLMVGAGLALDGVDGWLARRSGLASAFGARFDMEVDAALAALLSVLAAQGGAAGTWVLALGFLRYGFVAAAWGWPWLTRDLPPRPGRKTACVIQIAVLTALLAPPVVPPLSGFLAGGALAVLALSFAVDVLWLWRRR